MDEPCELSLAEIRNYMLENGNKVTNHALVKHFRKFLTNPETQNEARKQFKTYVNTLATIKNENNQKYLILRSKYLHECPTEGAIDKIDAPASPGGASIMSEGCGSPFRQPPPYKPPPEVSPVAVKVPILQQETKENYRDCVNEFVAAVNKIDPGRLERKKSEEDEAPPPSVPPRKRTSVDRSISRENSIEENKENVSIGSSESSSKISDGQVQDGENVSKDKEKGLNDSENQISVKEATKKFNRMASEEETKVLSPSSKKKPEKAAQNEKAALEVTIAHPKAKEWIVAGAKADYQDLAKLALEHPELVKLQDPTTTALHWAAKHGNEDVVKLIAGTYKADVNARTNGGYTPLHLAMQFGKDNIFELLCNVYKANRDLADWSGNKPLDYRKQRTTVSASTYSSEYDFQLQTVPRRKKAVGGAFVSMRKKSRPRLQATGSMTRGQSMIIPPDYHRTFPQHFFGDRSSAMPQFPATNLNLYGPPPSPGFQSDDQVEYREGKTRDRRSATHYSKIKARKKQSEKDLGFLRIGSLNVRVKKTTEAFSNFLGVGSGSTSSNTQASHRHHHSRHHAATTTRMNRNRLPAHLRTSAPPKGNQFDKLHKSWGSADNIPHDQGTMPPPANSSIKKNRSKQSADNDSAGYSSMPTTPNQLRAPIGILSENPKAESVMDSDSDSACGFGSNWSVTRSGGSDSIGKKAPTYL